MTEPSNEDSVPDLIVKHALKPVIAEAERLRAELDTANSRLTNIDAIADTALDALAAVLGETGEPYLIDETTAWYVAPLRLALEEILGITQDQP